MTTSDKQQLSGQPQGNVLGDALSVLEPLLELIGEERYGSAREMLVLALANMRDPRVEQVLIELLNEEQLAGTLSWPWCGYG